MKLFKLAKGSFESKLLESEEMALCIYFASLRNL